MDECEKMNAQTMPCREKFWTELKEHEQIERMRQEVKNAQSQIAELRQEIYSMHISFSAHAHVGDKIVVPLSHGSNAMKSLGGQIMVSRNPNEVYF